MINLIDRASKHKDRIAVVSDGHSYSYAELQSKSDAVATFLLNKAIDLDEARVAFLVDPSFSYTAIQWGIWKAGGVAVPLCNAHPLEAMEYVIRDSQVSMVISSVTYKQRANELADRAKIPNAVYEEIPESSPEQLPVVELDRRAMILYTSGTTNLPKGVVTTHANIEFQIKSLVEAWQWQKEDWILNILPLHHVHGIINVMSCALWSGACCEFLPRFDAAKVWERFQSKELSLFMAVPTIYFKLMKFWEECDDRKKETLSESCDSFRLMVSGSAALPIPVLERWKSITHQLLLERYGMTEIGMALSNPYDAERRPGHVGQPLPDVEIRLRNDDGVVTVENIEGEIQVKGPNVFLEYWNKPEATAESFTEDGWFKSGDIAVYSAGYYRILGRNSVDIIKSGGYKISALEVEAALLSYPGIAQCGVVGLADEEWGEVVTAAIVLNGAAIDTGQLKQYLKAKLPDYKVPRRYYFLDELPRNTIGKLTKKPLQKRLLELDIATDNSAQ